MDTITSVKDKGVTEMSKNCQLLLIWKKYFVFDFVYLEISK